LKKNNNLTLKNVNVIHFELIFFVIITLFRNGRNAILSLFQVENRVLYIRKKLSKKS